MPNIDIPSDMFFLFIIKMDLPMLDNLLDDDQQYLGLSKQEFTAWLGKEFERFKALGDTDLLALEGRFNNQSEACYSFMGNHSKQNMQLVIQVNDQKEITHLTTAEDFVFNDFKFGKLF